MPTTLPSLCSSSKGGKSGLVAMVRVSAAEAGTLRARAKIMLRASSIANVFFIVMSPFKISTRSAQH